MISRIKHRLSRLIFGEKKQPFFTKDHFIGKKYIIGNYTYGKPRVMFEHTDANLTIGKYCSIAENVTILLGGNHRMDWVSTYPFTDLPEYFGNLDIKGHPATNGSVTIENDVWIGLNSVIMSGVTISNGAVVGANSVVTKNIGPYEIWAGNPAKFIKHRFDLETIDNLLDLKWWNWDDDQVKKNIHLLCSSNIQKLNKQ